MWPIFIISLLFLLSLFLLILNYNINYLIFIIVFIVYMFMLNILKKNKKIKLTIFEIILLFIIVFKITMLFITLIYNLLSCFILDLDPLFILENNNNNNNNNNIMDTNNNRNIYFSNDSWSSTIRSLFIYGSAGIAIYVTRANGSGFRKIATRVGAFLADSAGKIIENAINDSSYVRSHHTNWKMMWKTDNNDQQLNDTVNIDISGDTELKMKIFNEIKKTLSSSDIKSFLPSFDNIYEQFFSLSNDLLLSIIGALKPQQVSYSIELLMDQHHVISISLFILTIISFIFFILFLYNIILLLYKDKLLKFFKNKYILMYLNLQFKIMIIENFILNVFLLHNFYYLLKGLHFLVIYPINININN